MIDIKTFSQALPILQAHNMEPQSIGGKLWRIGAMTYDKGGVIAVARELAERPPPAPAPALSIELQAIAREYLTARKRAGEAWLETARYLAEARQIAKHGEWYIFLEATGTSADAADRLLAIHDQAERDPRFREAVQNNFLSVSTAYELTTAPPAVREQLLSGAEPPTRQQIREAKRGSNPAPARDLNQATMFDAPAANPNYSDVALPTTLPAPAAAAAPFWQSMSPNHPTAHLWTRVGMNEYRAGCGMTAQRAPSGSTETGHCSSCVRATWPQNQQSGAINHPDGSPAPPATQATCVRCGSPRTEHRHLTSYERDLVPEYPGRSVTLCSRCIPDMLSERKQALLRLDEQLPPLLHKNGYFWQSAAPPTIAHDDGWQGDAPTVDGALQLARDHLRKKTENDPRLQAAQLLKQLAPLLLAMPAPDQEQLSMAIADLNECQEGTEARHWLAVGAVLIGLETTKEE